MSRRNHHKHDPVPLFLCNCTGWLCCLHTNFLAAMCCFHFNCPWHMLEDMYDYFKLLCVCYPPPPLREPV